MRGMLPNYLNPSTYMHKALRWIAPTLRQHLAVTPLIWGDARNVSIGANVQLVDVIINCRSGRVVIEDDAFFGHGVMLLTGSHDMRRKGRDRHAAVPDGGRDIVIRQGAWVASNTVVLGPCEIGENAVIGAGSVVTGTIEAGSLYTGNPARRVRSIDFLD